MASCEPEREGESEGEREGERVGRREGGEREREEEREGEREGGREGVRGERGREGGREGGRDGGREKGEREGREREGVKERGIKAGFQGCLYFRGAYVSGAHIYYRVVLIEACTILQTTCTVVNIKMFPISYHTTRNEPESPLPTEPPRQPSWLGSNHTSYARQSV